MRVMRAMMLTNFERGRGYRDAFRHDGLSLFQRQVYERELEGKTKGSLG